MFLVNKKNRINLRNYTTNKNDFYAGTLSVMELDLNYMDAEIEITIVLGTRHMVHYKK